MPPAARSARATPAVPASHVAREPRTGRARVPGLGRSRLVLGVLLLLAACAETPLAPLAFRDQREGIVVGEPSAVLEAAARTLRELDLSVETSRFDEDGGIIVAHSRLDDRVRIEVERGEHHSSRLTVQAEWLEDGRLASAVFDRIRSDL